MPEKWDGGKCIQPADAEKRADFLRFPYCAKGFCQPPGAARRCAGKAVAR
jgi:hypothetical protein